VDVASLIISVIAFLIALASAVYTRRGANAQKDSARAAELANELTQCARDEAAEQRAQDAAEREVVWSIDFYEGHAWLLSNRGTATARDVWCEANDAQFSELPDHEDIPSNGTHRIMWGRTMTSPGLGKITVHWDSPRSPKTLTLPPGG
jgi:type II secretory pathway pseudopilin PulG